MNRIILIGNGFDLAHGMATSYTDFLNDYWEKTIKEVQNSAGQAIFENEDFTVRNVPFTWYSGNSYSDFKKGLKSGSTRIEFKNQFLSNITEKKYLQNWVDIENEYYSEVKRNLDIKKENTNSDSIEKLNSDFNRIMSLLKEYLNRVENEFDKTVGNRGLRIKNMIGQKIYAPISFKDLTEEALNAVAAIEYEKIGKEITAVDTGVAKVENLSETEQRLIRSIRDDHSVSNIKHLLQSESALNYFDLVPIETLLLSFNYTYTEQYYKNPAHFDNYNDEKDSKTMVNHIHGTIDTRDDNPLIFGFGDELDDDYLEIEKLNDNRFLENIKSIKYLETDNYKKLLQFVNRDSYQIFIFGHSCGISDRTLLNTLFENKNCVSIKVFYHQIDGDNDNYSDIIKNISRNFNNKTKMRDVVVNKKYCEPIT